MHGPKRCCRRTLVIQTRTSPQHCGRKKRGVTPIRMKTSKSSMARYTPRHTCCQNGICGHLINPHPHRLTQTPDRLTQTPHRLSQTPDRLTQTPDRLIQTPHRLSQTPDRLTQTPHRLTQTATVVKKFNSGYRTDVRAEKL